MTEEHLKTVAKLQHFYDIMAQRLSKFEDDSISCCDEIDRMGCREKSIELSTLVFEYSKLFQECLYKDTE